MRLQEILTESANPLLEVIPEIMRTGDFQQWDKTICRAYDRVTGSTLTAGRSASEIQEDEIDDAVGGLNRWIADNRPAFEAAFTAILREKAQEYGDRYIRQGRVLLHRVMGLPYDPVAAIRGGKRDLGQHWSHISYHDRPVNHMEFSSGYHEYHDPDRDERTRYGIKFSRGIKDYVFTVETPVSSIDADITLYRYVDFDDFEKETWLNLGSP